MAVEDMRAGLAREVQAQIELIEESHQSEMRRMRAIILETNVMSAQLDLIVKDVLSETSTRNGSPTPTDDDSCSAHDDSLSEVISATLGTSLTPIRIPLQTVSPTTVSGDPLRFSIASPSRRRSDTGDFSDSSGDQENVHENIASIWSNFSKTQ